jgi:glucans biosynthesis protein C
MLSVFTYHTTMFFNLWGWHAKNNQLSPAITVVSLLIGQYIMPVFFAVSGISVYHALQFRRSGTFAKERVLRLMIPLVFGIFVLSPHQVYIDNVINHHYQGSFVQFFPHYFEGLYGFGGNFAWMGLHLWYLLILFLFSMIVLPIFAGFKKNGASLTLVLLTVIPPVCFQALLDPKGLGMNDFGGWNLFVYLSYFMSGYYVFSHLKFREVLNRCRWFFWLGAVVFNVWFLIEFTLGPSDVFGSFRYMEMGALRVVSSWLLIMSIFQLGQRYLNKNSARLQYCNEVVMPFYVMHQPVIVGIAFFLYDRSWSIPLKFVVLYVSAFSVIMLVYTFIVKPIPPLRFLLGMKFKGREKRDQSTGTQSMVKS